MKFLVGCFIALPLVAAQSFSIEQVLSAPFPDNLVASPKADAVAWVLDASGVRNIWVARAPDFKGVAITKFGADDGQEIADLAWTPDESSLIFRRGGPNPTSNPAGTREEIWVAPLAGGARKVGDGRAPSVAPDGSIVAWIYNGQVWSAPLNGSSPPTQLIHARGSAYDFHWAPDGSRLAFTSDRGDHALIGIYDRREKSLGWLDPSVDTDQSPSWSADGKQVAFIRVPAWRNDTGWGQAPKPVGQPWSIRTADAETGKGREIWRAQQGMGSVFWPTSSSRQLLWIPGERIVFPWERDGWLHLYALSLRGKAAPALLTHGSFEVDGVSLTPDRSALIVSSNQGDIDRRHLWRVRLDDEHPEAPEPLTEGHGIEWSPAALTEDSVALLHSDAKMPARAAILEKGRMRDLAPSSVPADFPASALFEPQPVVFPSPDGLQLHGQLFLPTDDSSGKHPAVVFFHGGPRRQMLLGWHPMQYYNQAYGFNQYLASKGYVVLSVNYRSGIGYGTNFREPLHYGATGAIEFNDVLGAGRYLRSRTDVDPFKIGAWGGSYGGYLTALGLARASDLFAVGVDLHGIHDWNLEFPGADPPRSAETMRVAFESSPLASIDTWRSPVLLIQGDDDRNVAFSQTVRLAEALRKQGVPFEQLIFPDEVHDFLLHAHWVAAYHAADAFLGRYLKPHNEP